MKTIAKPRLAAPRHNLSVRGASLLKACLPLSVAISAVILPLNPASAQTYNVTLASALGGPTIGGLNDADRVVGQLGSNAFRWDPAHGPQTLFPGAAYDINNLGEIAGMDSNGAEIYQDGKLTLIAPFTLNATCINSGGAVGGTWGVSQPHSDPINDAYVWFPTTPGGTTGTFTGLGIAFSNVGDGFDELVTAHTTALNDAGEAAVTSDEDEFYEDSGEEIETTRAYLWTAANGLASIEAPDLADYPQALGIDSRGDIVGESDTLAFVPDGFGGGYFATTARHAFLFQPASAGGYSGTSIDLGNLGIPAGSNATYASGVNDHGAVVGASNNVAFIWDSVHGMRDLNALISPGSGWVLQVANKINNNGAIDGTGIYNGYNAAFLLTLPSLPPIENVPAPAIYPEGGNLNYFQAVALTDSLPGSTIHYTLDGSQPTGRSPIYTQAFLVKHGDIVTAIATADGYDKSATHTAQFHIVAPPPSFHPISGGVSAGMQITITDPLGSGASIYYTTDGSEPTTASTLYAGPVRINVTKTIRAVAVAAGYLKSPSHSETYTVSSGS